MSWPSACPICEESLTPWDRDPEVLCCDLHAWGACPRCGRGPVPLGTSDDGLTCGPCATVGVVPWVALVAEEVAALEAVRGENEAFRRSGGRS